MTDFLTRLAQRALGIAPLVQPALAPKYGVGPEMEGTPEPEEERDSNGETGEGDVDMDVDVGLEESPEPAAAEASQRRTIPQSGPHAPLDETLPALARTAARRAAPDPITVQIPRIDVRLPAAPRRGLRVNLDSYLERRGSGGGQ